MSLAPPTVLGQFFQTLFIYHTNPKNARTFYYFFQINFYFSLTLSSSFFSPKEGEKLSQNLPPLIKLHLGSSILVTHFKWGFFLGFQI